MPTTLEKLIGLYLKSSFSEEEKPPKWDGLKIDEDGHVWLPQGSHLGETLIALDDTYETSGADCLFIQELIASFRRFCLDHKLEGKNELSNDGAG